MIPKSLHTVTALVNVARALFANAHPNSPRKYVAAEVVLWVDAAADVLGYGGAEDNYALKMRAVAQLLNSVKVTP